MKAPTRRRGAKVAERQSVLVAGEWITDRREAPETALIERRRLKPRFRRVAVARRR